MKASASSTSNQGSGTVTLGDATIQSTTFSLSDIAYSLRIKADAAGNVATLTIPTGAVAQTTGSPEVTRWGTQVSDLDGEDFEGVTLPTLVTLYGYCLETSGLDGTLTIACSNDALPDLILNPQQQTIFHSFGESASTIASLGTMAFTFANEDDYVDIFVIGKSS